MSVAHLEVPVNFFCCHESWHCGIFSKLRKIPRYVYVYYDCLFHTSTCWWYIHMHHYICITFLLIDCWITLFTVQLLRHPDEGCGFIAAPPRRGMWILSLDCSFEACYAFNPARWDAPCCWALSTSPYIHVYCYILDVDTYMHLYVYLSFNSYEVFKKFQIFNHVPNGQKRHGLLLNLFRGFLKPAGKSNVQTSRLCTHWFIYTSSVLSDSIEIILISQMSASPSHQLTMMVQTLLVKSSTIFKYAPHWRLCQSLVELSRGSAWHENWRI